MRGQDKANIITKDSKRAKLFDQESNLHEIGFGGHRSLCDKRQN